jgi:hypothetical protein
MANDDQGVIRLLLLAALLLGVAVWYSWTAHRGSGAPARVKPVTSAVEVRPPAD